MFTCHIDFLSRGMSLEQSKKILVGVTASIALYKACDLVRNLTKLGYDVQVVMTHNASQWIAPLVFETLSGNNVITPQDANDSSDLAMPHIDLRNELDLFLIAPATADCIARAALGRADDPLCATLLSYEGTKMFAPAMNPFMYKHPATQKNLQILQSYGYKILSPANGAAVCGDIGEGKMMAVEDIIEQVELYFKNA